MKNILQATGAVLALAAVAVLIMAAFVTLEASRGQTPALAPTPTPQAGGLILTNPIVTPTVSLTPAGAPKPDRPVVDPWVADPNWGRSPEPTFPVRPTPTPRPATGGPYISEAKAIEIAVASVVADGQVDETIPPKALFTRAKEIPAIIGKPNPAASSEREVWVVWVYGRFKGPRSPGGENPVVFARAEVIMDATTGEISIWGLLDGH